MTEALSRLRAANLRHVLAISLFVLVYAGTLLLLFGPQDLFQAQPGASILVRP